MARKKELIVNISKFRTAVNRNNQQVLDNKVKLIKENRNMTDDENKNKKLDTFNQQWVAEKFPTLVERKHKIITINGVKSAVGYNELKTLQELKKENKGFEKRVIEDYNRDILNLAQFIGLDINELSKGTVKNVDQLTKLLQYSHDIEIENTRWKANADYETTRTWSSDDWKQVDEFKNHLNSDQAIDLKYAIDNNDTDTIKHFIDVSGSSGLKEKIGKVIDIEKLMNEELFEE
jgi:hypothetical protein